MRLADKQNGTRRPRSIRKLFAGILLDLGLAEFDVLARDRIVLLLDELVGHGARILLGDVIEAGIRRGNELDLDGDLFGHVHNLKYQGIHRRPSGLHLRGNLASDGPKSRFCGPKSARFRTISPESAGFSAAAEPGKEEPWAFSKTAPFVSILRRPDPASRCC